MAARNSRMKRFVSELNRRHVLQVAVIYATGAAAVLTVAHLAFPELGLRRWAFTFVAGVVILGFPFALALAWIYELRPDEGSWALRDQPASPDPGAAAMQDAAHAGGRVASAVAAGPIGSIAVLPFVDMSPEKDQEYFSDGMTEELLNVLSRIPELRVPARTSTFVFKDQHVDVREIGRKLNVEAVLEGSVRKWEDRILVTAQLIGVADGYHIWSERYQRELKDIFAMQEEIAAAIVDALRLRFDEGAALPRITSPTRDPGAYTLYLKGRHLFNRASGDDLKKAVTFFLAALERDPGFAAACAGLGDAYMNLGYYGHLPRQKAYPRAKEAVRRALELDPALAEAHTSAAWIALRVDWDFAAAEREYRRALALKPAYAMAHQGFALYLTYMGRLEEALGEARRAIELVPLSVAASNALGVVYMYLHRTERAIQQFQASLELDPGRAVLLCNLALVHAYSGRHTEAFALARRAVDLSGGNIWALGALGYAHAAAGERDGAEQVLQTLEIEAREGKISPCFVAVIHVALGEYDQALGWLELAYERRDDLLLVLKVDPIYDPLRADPRFEALLRRTGLSRPESLLAQA